MRKIIITFDGVHYPKGVLEFARRLNEREPILLAGVFIPAIDASSYWSYAAGEAGGLFVPFVDPAKAETVKANISSFKTFCAQHAIDCRVHEDYDDPNLPALVKESRFSDLLIVEGEQYYQYIGEREPNSFLRETLFLVECPVLIIPENFEFPDSNILAYDGSKSSAYAIRQFAYLFPEFCSNRTLLIYANEEESDEIPDEEYIEELAARHFKDLTLMKLHLNANQYFATWAADKKSSVLVTGAFGRSSFSRLFKKSFITEIIRDRQLPVFIAHK
jgi:hypothetical protein